MVATHWLKKPKAPLYPEPARRLKHLLTHQVELLSDIREVPSPEALGGSRSLWTAAASLLAVWGEIGSLTHYPRRVLRPLLWERK